MLHLAPRQGNRFNLKRGALIGPKGHAMPALLEVRTEGKEPTRDELEAVAAADDPGAALARLLARCKRRGFVYAVEVDGDQVTQGDVLWEGELSLKHPPTHALCREAGLCDERGQGALPDWAKPHLEAYQQREG